MNQPVIPGKTNYAMEHWNNKMCCVIDTETTGLDPTFHEIIQIAVVPLTSNFDVMRGVLPFHVNLKPEYPERADAQALSVNKRTLVDIMDRGMDKMKALDLFDDWFHKLEIKMNKYGNPNKIMPLGQNYGFDKSFIQAWMGCTTYDNYFDYHYRDTMHAALYLNDRAGAHAERVPFPKVNLQYLATTLKIESDRAHDALEDCITTAKVYKQLCFSGLMG